MKPLPVALTALFASALTVAAAPLEFRFSGQIRVDQQNPEPFTAIVHQNQVRFIDFEGGLKLELSAPRDIAADRSQTDVRLLQQVLGDEFRILHEAHVMSPPRRPRTFAYLVCGLDAQYISPAPAVMPTCAS